jgi:hypothetical protein
MTFPKVRITAAERTGKYRSYTLSAIYGIKLIEALSDDVLLKVIEEEATPEFTAVSQRIGPNTNPSWVTARAAETLYFRGVIDAAQMDHICR